jgi:formylmethanofuran dehydrogenase subunit E
MVGATGQEAIMIDENVCGMDFNQFVLEMEAFHGARAPGIAVGALMLDTALATVGESPDLAIVVETYNCLPDAAQVLTSCTIGNGRLKVYDWGKFALSAYNRASMEGLRTWVIPETVAKWPLINAWFNPAGRSSGPPDFADLAEVFFKARPELIGIREVRIRPPEMAATSKKTGICRNCGESYYLKCGDLCSACQGMAYYTTP